MFILPNYPHTTSWLDDEEKAFAAWRLLRDINEADEYKDKSVWDGVKLAVLDYRLYLFVLMQHVSLLSQSFQYFFPTIVGMFAPQHDEICSMLTRMQARLAMARSRRCGSLRRLGYESSFFSASTMTDMNAVWNLPPLHLRDLDIRQVQRSIPPHHRPHAGSLCRERHRDCHYVSRPALLRYVSHAHGSRLGL